MKFEGKAQAANKAIQFFLHLFKISKNGKDCCLISSARSKWRIHFSGHPCGSPRLSPGVCFRAFGVCAGGTALACVSSPCSQSAAWPRQLNLGESQPSLNVQLPQSHSFKPSNAMQLFVSMSHFLHVYVSENFLIISAPLSSLNGQFGSVEILHHSTR